MRLLTKEAIGTKKKKNSKERKRMKLDSQLMNQFNQTTNEQPTQYANKQIKQKNKQQTNKK